MLDNALEFMMMNGMELPLAVMVTIPEPWANNDTISQDEKDFHQYYATMMEPWDGPASILFSDGDMMGAVLDRNGLRPSRYYLTQRQLSLSIIRDRSIRRDPGRGYQRKRKDPPGKAAGGGHDWTQA